MDKARFVIRHRVGRVVTPHHFNDLDAVEAFLSSIKVGTPTLSVFLQPEEINAYNGFPCDTEAAYLIVPCEKDADIAKLKSALK